MESPCEGGARDGPSFNRPGYAQRGWGKKPSHRLQIDKHNITKVREKVMTTFFMQKDLEEKKGICFLHGWLMSPDIWTASVTAVARRGWRAVALEQPAHGQSLPPGGALSMEGWADQTIEQLQALGLERCIFVGHSMGGMLALTIVGRHPNKVLGLGLVGTTDEPSTAEASDSFMSLTARVSDHWSEETADLVSSMLFGKAFLQAHPTFLGEWRETVSRYALKDMRAIGQAVIGRPDNTQVAAQLSVPTVVIHGEDDAAVWMEAGVQLANRISHATLVRLPAVGHCPPLEAPSAVTAEVIRLAEVCLGQKQEG